MFTSLNFQNITNLVKYCRISVSHPNSSSTFRSFIIPHNDEKNGTVLLMKTEQAIAWHRDPLKHSVPMRPLNLTWVLFLAIVTSTMSFIRSNPSVHRLATSTTNILLRKKYGSNAPSSSPSQQRGALSMQQYSQRKSSSQGIVFQNEPTFLRS